MKMNEDRNQKLIKVYKAYNVVDWIIAIVIMGTPFALLALEGLGMPSISLESLLEYIGNLPMLILLPLFVVYTGYTVFCIVLYIKVWCIKEIRNTFTYWFDWFLTFVLMAYEIFIFYAIFAG